MHVRNSDWLAIKRSAGTTPEVNFREHTSPMPPSSANKAGHSDFETQSGFHQKSQTVVSVASQKVHVSTKVIKYDEKRIN